jgi:CheY-like chemotaxis protein
MFEQNEGREKIESEARADFELLRPRPPEADLPSYTIHLVDHDSEVLLSLFDFLSGAGFRVSASSNASDGLDYVARLHPDILIANMEMPELTGSEVLQRVKMMVPSTRVILTSVQAERADLERVLRGGGADLIAKPIDGSRLLKALEKVLAV